MLHNHFNALLSGKLSLNDLKKFKGYKKLITHEKVPDKYKFRLDNWNFLIIVGTYPKTFPKEIKNRLKVVND